MAISVDIPIKSVMYGGGTIPLYKPNIEIGKGDTAIKNILNLFYALEQGTAKTGEFTLATALPATETLVISTGLTTVNGMFIADEDMNEYRSGSTPENILFTYGAFDGESAIYAMSRITIQMTVFSGSGASKEFLTRCTWRMDDGDLYATATFGGNANYSPFYPGHTYRWVAW